MLMSCFALSQDLATVSADEGLANFINQFELSNVGNLHIYAKPESQPVADYYLHGKVLGDGFGTYLTPGLWKDTRSGTRVNAVFAIKYNDDQNNLFIINEHKKGKINKLGLYRLNGQQLEMVQPLAYLKKTTSGAHKQMDTWIQDVDGDTLLDLIQRKRTTSENGVSDEVITKVLLQQPDGSFQVSNDTGVNSADYIFHSVTE